MELSGRRRVQRSAPEAGRWLARSQLLLMAAVILYSAYHLLLVNPLDVLKDFTPQDRSALLQTFGAKETEGMITTAFHILYLALIAGTLLYQGGLCLYYALATRKLARAMSETPKE
jgi:hypothetical protein